MGEHTEYIARHIKTDLCFGKRLNVDNSAQIEFTKGKQENKHKKMQVLPEKHNVQVRDIRGQESSYTLDKNGFVYLLHEMPELARVSDEEYVKETIIPETESLVRNITGATRTVTFAHRVRCLAEDGALLARNRAPAHSVHSDFTIRGALHNLETVFPDTRERKRLLTGRVLIINVWRPLKPIQRDPLTVCDWSSVNIEAESIPTCVILPNGWNEVGRYAFSPSQRWCYLSAQQPNEPLIFTQFDSSKVDEGGFTVPHSAFVDPEYSDFAARESLEIKMFAFV